MKFFCQYGIFRPLSYIICALLVIRHFRGLILVHERISSQISGDEESCTSHSLHHYAIDLARYSSPRESLSWKKNKLVLLSSSYFHVQLHSPIFSGVADQIVEMLVGFGLNQLGGKMLNSSLNPNTIIVENSFFAGIQKMSSCIGMRCNKMPRIIIQSEQERHGLSEYLIACHIQSNCVIWEFSDYNYRWEAAKYNLSASVLLLPLMFQDRLRAFRGPTLVPLNKRSIDLVFFLEKHQKDAMKSSKI